MIGLVLTMMRARRAQAVTLFLLAAIAVAAAVAGPVSMRATDEAVVRLEVANATARERAISLIVLENPTAPESLRQLESLIGYVAQPGFEVIRGGELTIFGPSADPAAVQALTGTRLVFRDGLCGHVTILDGRCLIGNMELIVGAQTAARTGLRPGDVATVQALAYDPDGRTIPDGAPATMTVVGVYDPIDVDEPYWGGQRYFPINADGTRTEAVFTTVGTVELLEHTLGTGYLDSLVPPSELTAQRLADLSDVVDDAAEQVSGLSGVLMATAIPQLAERVATSRELARQLGPVAFIPLAGVSLFVIYLAVAYGVFGRRSELGLVALRGVSTRRRWVLATGETVIAILLGAPVGYVLGHLGVGLVARLRLGTDEGTGLSLASLPYAAGAVAIALAVALLGQRRAVAEPVVELLRGVPRSRGVWSAVAIETLIGALAVVATLQLRTAGEQISGLGLLVPGLLVVAVGLLAARIYVAVTAAVARFSLRRGLLGAGLAAVQLARRPGSHRLFVLLAIGAAMLAFVAAGMDVAARAREDRASVQTGASRVLQVQAADARRLLWATADLDPDGRWAMAAVVVPPTDPRQPTVLAVDTSRLGAVAVWRPEFGADPAAVASAIAPPPEAPLIVRGSELSMDVEVDFPLEVGAPYLPVDVFLEFVTLDGRARSTASVSDLAVGMHTVTMPLGGCAEGCRLVAVTIGDVQPYATHVVLRGLRQVDPPVELVSVADLTDRERWRAAPDVSVVPTSGGLGVRWLPRDFLQENTIRVALADGPLPVPVVSAGLERVGLVSSLDETLIPSQAQLELSMLPRLGTYGVLADLSYLERTTVGTLMLEGAEIWLGPDAPADAVEQFRALGLAVVAESTVVQERAILARQGPALALQFHLAAAAFGVLLALGGLGLVAAVDRRARAADLRALRVHGLPRRMVRRAALWGYLATVIAAGLTGLAGALVAWAVAGDRIPIFTEAAAGLEPPRWPLWPAVVQPWAATTLAMAVAAVIASWVLRRAVRSGGNGDSR